jgi:hypothetical protein
MRVHHLHTVELGPLATLLIAALILGLPVVVALVSRLNDKGR